MILVTGGTGSIGSHLLPLLVERGAPLRVVAHTPASRDKIEALGAEAVDGDFDRPDSLEPAMEGCDRVFLLSPTHPDVVTRETAAIDAARRAGVSHVVKLSAMGADTESPCSFLSRHAEIDAHLMSSGLDYTLLQPACFMHIHLLPVPTVKAQGVWYGMTGDGPHAYIDTQDIAAAAAAVLTTAGHEGKTYELTGPQAITMPEAASQLSEVIGSTVEYVDVPAEQFASNLADVGFPGWLVEGVVALYQTIRDGHLAPVTGSVEELKHSPARSYADFAQAHKGAFVES